jgi:predicted nucleic acid-binding protein
MSVIKMSRPAAPVPSPRGDEVASTRPIPENDVWIAALALQHEQAVVSRDEHFDSIGGLVRVAW